jgi:hypothetical protein
MQGASKNIMVIKELKASIFDGNRLMFDKFEYPVPKSNEQGAEDYLHFAFMNRFTIISRIWEHWILNKS